MTDITYRNFKSKTHVRWWGCTLSVLLRLLLGVPRVHFQMIENCVCSVLQVELCKMTFKTTLHQGHCLVGKEAGQHFKPGMQRHCSSVCVKSYCGAIDESCRAQLARKLLNRAGFCCVHDDGIGSVL